MQNKQLFVAVLGAAFLLVALTPASALAESIYEAVEGKLVVEDKRKVVPIEDTERVANAKYYAIYFSAHWCPPCRRFTPKLVKFYRSMTRKYDDFDIIFVSYDKTEEAMANYMEETDMRWPAIEFSQAKKIRKINGYYGRGIPNLVFVDAEGKVLSSSYVNDKYVGPEKVMDDIKDYLKEQKKLAGR